MQNAEDLSPKNPDLPEALRNLELAPLTSSPRAIWYEAGAVAGRRSANQWRAAAAVAITACLALALWDQSNPASHRTSAHRSDTTVSIPTTVAVPAPTDVPAAYARLRDALVQQGLDALYRDPAKVDPGTYAPTGWYPHENGG